MYTHLRYRAGFAGAFIDREIETKGVSDIQRLSRTDVGSDLLSSGQIARLCRQAESKKAW